MIRSAKIQGFRCLREVEVRLNPFTVLIGRNDSGKTAFLDALFGLSRSSLSHLAGGKNSPFKGIYSIGNQAWASADEKKFSLEVECDVPGIDGLVRYGVVLGANPDGTTYSTGEFLECGNSVEFTYDGLTLHQTRLSEERSTGREITKAIKFARYLSAMKKVWLRPEALKRACEREMGGGTEDEHAVPQIKPDGFGLPLVIDYLQRNDFKDRRFTKILERMRTMFPSIAMIEATSTTLWKTEEGPDGSPRETPVAGVKLEVGLKNDRGKTLPVPLISEGAILILGYYAAVATSSSPLHLMIEEPETGIHVGALHSVVDALRSLASGTDEQLPVQVIVTTHSPYLLDLVDPEDVRVFERMSNGESRVTAMVDTPGFKKHGKDFLLGELWGNELEEGLMSGKLSTAVGGSLPTA